MTTVNGTTRCDICEKKLCGQPRYDVNKRNKIGCIKIHKHYCMECFDKKIAPLTNVKMKTQYELLCKALKGGQSIQIGNAKLNVFDAVMLKQKLEEKYGFKEED